MKLTGYAAIAVILTSGCSGLVTELGVPAAAQRQAIESCATQFGITNYSIRVEQTSSLFQSESKLTVPQSGPNGIRNATILNDCKDQALVAQGYDLSSTDRPQQANAFARRPDVPISPCPRGSAVMRGGSQYCVGLK